MQSFGILNADRSESTPTKMAYSIGVSIIDYVDRCFPEVEGSFSEIVDGITDDTEGALGDEVSRSLFDTDGGIEHLRSKPQFFYLPALCAAYAHDAILADAQGKFPEAWNLVASAAYWLGICKGGGAYNEIARDVKSQQARQNAETGYNKPGGSREKVKQIRDIWASGKYTSRDVCAEQECAEIGMSFSSARKALRNTPDPT